MSIDGSWKYEGRLPAAISALDDRTTELDGHLWAEVLVPFVSSLFIRGVEFINRYQSRLPGLTGPGGDPSIEKMLGPWHDSTLLSRQIEWQRILAPVMTAQWTVVHGSGAPILITNDVARCLMVKRGHPTTDVSYAFPITTSSVLVLEQRTIRRVLDWNGDKWTAPINHRDTTDDDLLNCRLAIQHGAVSEVYGPTREAVEWPAPGFKPTTPPIGAELLLPHPRGRALLPYLEDYFRLLTILASAPKEYYGANEKIDWNLVSQSWAGPVQVILDMPRFPGGLALTAFGVYLDLGRFSVEQVDASLGKGPEDLTLPPTEPRPDLSRLMEEDVRLRRRR